MVIPSSRSLDPNMRQSPSGRHRGAGGGTGPQPVVLQRKHKVCTEDASYIQQTTSRVLLEGTDPADEKGTLAFQGVTQNGVGSVAVYVDFRMAAFGNTGCQPVVEVQADLGNGAGYVAIPGMEQPRNTVGAKDPNQQNWSMQGKLDIPELTDGKVAVRVLWSANTDSFAIHTKRTPGSNAVFDAPGGWTLEAEIVQYTPDTV